MAKVLNVLLIEDVPRDAEAIENELHRQGLSFVSKRIESSRQLHRELDSHPPDVILSDFTLPDFDAIQALRIVQQRKLDIPFILVTGTRSEEVAVDCIKEGADDYILKASLMRLRSSITNTLHKRAAQREKARANETLRNLPRLILNAQETERHRVARDLHDSVNQILSSAKFRIQGVEEALANHPRERDQISQAKQLLNQAMQEVRRISRNLRPSELDDLGLLPAIRSLIKEFDNGTNLTVRLTASKVPETLPNNTELNLYRILQESLNNARKHAKASLIDLSLIGTPTSLDVSIHDNGRGFNPNRSRTASGVKPGMGLVDMRERARFVGGSLTIDSNPGKGTNIRLQIPLNPANSTKNQPSDDKKKED